MTVQLSSLARDMEAGYREGFGAGLEDAPAGPHALFRLSLGDALVFGDLAARDIAVRCGGR